MLKSNFVFKFSLFISLCWCLISCSDDFDYIHYSSDTITYTTTIESQWGTTSRSVSNDEFSMCVLSASCDSYQTPLYFHITSNYLTNGSTVNSTLSGSRGTMTESTEGKFNTSIYGSMGIVAYAYKNEQFPSGQSPNFIEHDEVSLTSNDICNNRYWPSDDCEICFFAYAPYKKDTFKDGIEGYPSFIYDTPQIIEDQTDLLVNNPYVRNSKNKSIVPIKFQHALTAVEINVSDDFEKGRITNISLNNINLRGKLEWSKEAFSWNNQCNPYSFSFDIGEQGILTGQNGSAIPVNPGNKNLTLLLIPQDLRDDACIEISFEDVITGKSHILKLPLNGSKWEAGKHITYTLSTSDKFIIPIFKIVPSECADYSNIENEDHILNYTQLFDYLGFPDSQNVTKIKTLKILSYAKVATSDSKTITRTPMKWNAEISYSDSKEKWLTLDNNNNNNLDNSYDLDRIISLSATQQSISDLSSKSPLLKKLTTKGSKTDPIDLSIEDNIRTTANCYIVNQPGWYSFPLVYGNAIKNNIPNNLSFIRTESAGGNSLDKLLNYIGTPISSPYIFEDCSSQMKNAQAVLLWQDGVNLIDDYFLDDEKKNFIFHVPSSSQGNFVLGLKDSKRNWIMWSWHIWLTDYSSSDDVTIPSSNALTIGPDNVGSDYVFMSKNIGWCDGHSIVYEGRTAEIEFRQTDQNGNETRKIFLNVDQVKHTDISIGNNTLYQWGRKDPIPGITLDEHGVAILKSIFSDSYSIEFKKDDDPTINDNTIPAAIRFPMMFYFFQNNSWTYEEIPCNLWAINQADYTGTHNLYTCIKTIYDPSPRGYKVPDNRVFHNLFHNQSQYSWVISSEEARLNGIESFSVPLSGIIDDITAKPTLYWTDPNDKISKRVGRFWTARSQSTNAGAHVCIKYWEDGAWINFHSEGCHMCTGMSIRPMKDN